MYQKNKMIQKMINFDDGIKEETKEHNLNLPQIPDHLYGILILIICFDQNYKPGNITPEVLVLIIKHLIAMSFELWSV